MISFVAILMLLALCSCSASVFVLPKGAATVATKQQKEVTVLITGGAGRIAYALIPLVCSGAVFGHDTKINLRLLDIKQLEEKLKGVVMEIEDCNYDLVESIVSSCDDDDDGDQSSSMRACFANVEVAVLLGGFPRLAGQERKDLIAKNAQGMKKQALLLQAHASPLVKVCVVANPANTNALVCMKAAPKIPRKNISCLTRLDEERLRFSLAKLAKRPAKSVKKAIIWGNHSSTQVPDVSSATISRNEATTSSSSSSSSSTATTTDTAASELFPTDESMDALIKHVQTRGAAIIKAQQASSGMSAANAIAAHLRDWLSSSSSSSSSSAAAAKATLGEEEEAAEEHQHGHVFSMGILSDGNDYGVPSDLIFSFPVRRVLGGAAGEVEIVTGLPMSEKIKGMLQETIKELQEEKSDAEAYLASATKE